VLTLEVTELESGTDSERATAIENAILMHVCECKFVLQRQISAKLKPARVEDLHAKV